MMSDYRESHKAPEKGVSYHAKFSSNPYRSMVWELEKEILIDVVHRLRTSPGTHLDFACGTGRVVAHLAPLMNRSIGVDVSSSMLAVAREASPGVVFMEIDITQDDQLDGCRFDWITAFRFFSNAQDELRYEAMQAISKLLSQDGYLIFNNHKNRYSAIYFLAGLFRKQQRDMAPGDVEELIRECGLTIVERHHIGVFPAIDRFRPLPIWALRALERFLGRFQWLGSVACNQIYVCKRG